MQTEISLLTPSRSTQPCLFVSHGAPTFALSPGAAGAALQRAAAMLTPRAVVIVSAHWCTSAPAVGFAVRPATVHDYHGFPATLHSITYPATGCKDGAARVLQVLRDADFDATGDATRGLDHGAWIPLRLMFPEADIPVIPLSIQPHLGPAHHLAIGRALKSLAAEGFLIVASGNLTHNLGDFQRAHLKGGFPPDYVRSFADWIWQHLKSGDEAALLDYRRLAPSAARAHPEEDHLLPLFVAMGVAGADDVGATVERLHAGIDDHVLAMDAFAFHPKFSDRNVC